MTFGTAEFYFDTSGKIGFNTDLALTLTPTYSSIANTGLTLTFQNAKLDFSRTTNIPEATAAGLPNDFVGIFIQLVEIGLPPFFKDDTHNNVSTAAIIGRNLLMGTGGFTGTIGLEPLISGTPNPILYKQLGDGCGIGLNSFDMSFKQDSITKCDISGELVLLNFMDASNHPAKINVKAHIDNDGFSITASETDGLPVINFKDIFELDLTSLSVGEQDSRWFVAVGAKLKFGSMIPSVLADILPKEIDIQKLTIWEDGKFEIQGGGITLAKAITIPVGPAKIQISAIHLGKDTRLRKDPNTHQLVSRDFMYFGFDGGVSVNPGGVDVKGKGIKFYFTVDSGHFDCFLQIEGISVDIVIPGTASRASAAVIIDGFLSLQQTASGLDEYIGGISLSLPKVGISASAGMRLIPSIPAFLIDVDVEISVPIPLGPTGLGIYGFRGLIGFKYLATKKAAHLPDDARWWEYYTAKVPPTNTVGVNVGKFEELSGFSLGAGISLATSYDSGYTFSSKIFLLFSLNSPDFLIMLEGQGALLSKRLGLDDQKDPPFFVQFVISSDSIEFAFGLNFGIRLDEPDPKNQIVAIKGLIQMGFFFHDSSAWYIDIGTDQQPITAVALSIFTGYAYLMLSGSGIKAGVGAKWDFEKKFGPVKVIAKAYVDAWGQINFRPSQFGGGIDCGIELGIYVFGIGFGLGLDASLSGTASKQFIIQGSLTIWIKVLWKKFQLSFKFKWTIRKEQDIDPLPVLDTSSLQLSPGSQTSPVKAVNMRTGEPFAMGFKIGMVVDQTQNQTIAGTSDISWIDPNQPVPLDSYIDINFIKSVLLDSTPGITLNRMPAFTPSSGNTENFPPQKAVGAQVLHNYEVKDVKIYYFDTVSNQWADYDPYVAITSLSVADVANNSIPNPGPYQLGFWQAVDPNKVNKLRIGARTPLSWINNTAGGAALEYYGFNGGAILCAGQEKTPVCLDWLDKNLGQVYTQSVLYDKNAIGYKTYFKNATVTNFPNVFGAAKSLQLQSASIFEVILPEPAGQVSFELTSYAVAVEVIFYEYVNVSSDPSNNPVFAYRIIESIGLSPGDLVQTRYYPSSPDGSQFYARGQGKQIAKIDFLVPQQENYVAQQCQKNFSAILSAQMSAINPVIRSLGSQITQLQSQLSLAQQMCTATPSDPASCNQVSVLQQQISELQSQLSGYQTFIRTIRGIDGYTGTKPYCDVLVHDICYLGVTDYYYNQSVPDQQYISTQNSIMGDGLQRTVQPIWWPNTYFAFEVHYRDRVNGGGDDLLPHNIAAFGFKTGKPLGQYYKGNPIYGALDDTKKQAFKYFDLTYYLDFDRSYPNADGNTLNAKPIFYSQQIPSPLPGYPFLADPTSSDPTMHIDPSSAQSFYTRTLNLYYLDTYMYLMMNNWNPVSAYPGLPQIYYQIQAVIKDPALPAGETEPTLNGSWQPHFSPVQSAELQTYSNLLANGENCSGMPSTLTYFSMHNEFVLPDLKPDKTYNAVFLSEYSEDGINFTGDKILGYTFSTSRYPNFYAQIMSYKLVDAKDSTVVKDSLFTVNVNTGASVLNDISNLLAGITYTNQDQLVRDFQDTYDRIMDGMLKTGAIPPAIAHEFNIINATVNSATVPVAYLIRNPEPLNDPRMAAGTTGNDPWANVIDTVQHLSDGSSVDKAHWTTIYSKDKSRALIFLKQAGGTFSPMVPAGLTLVNTDFTFRYKEYDPGAMAYAAREVLTVII